MWASLTKDEPCANIISECSSLECQKEIRPVYVLGVNHHTIQQKGFGCIEETVQYNFFIKNIKCQHSECTGRRTNYTEVKSHVYIELDIKGSLTEKRRMRCKLNDISPTINILKQEYRLAGIIEYIRNHYIAYGKKVNGSWEKYNDISPSILKCNKNNEIEPHAAIYVCTKNKDI
ncbi:uncharacterized protein LOC112590553 [Harpegnathos saltator]|uniref:uncharacterized protein LOC112590553 n=1 Tax=Harpegnathos saltator TaxID=610380 RepID=UPI000DBEDA36|nr:uncharacterized protein LOC112590553 [Harpegnathos saltator]